MWGQKRQHDTAKCADFQCATKSEQCSASTSTKGVAKFQASLKVVREEAGAHLSQKDNKHFTFHGLKNYAKRCINLG